MALRLAKSCPKFALILQPGLPECMLSAYLAPTAWGFVRFRDVETASRYAE